MTAQPQNARLRPFRPVAFGRYTLLSPLSMGGMGEIFLGRLEGAQGFEKLCVIKKILPQLASDAEFVDRFVNEAKILVKLSHGSIAQVLDVGLHEGDPYMALEYVDGKDLRKVAARARDRNVPLPLTLVLHVMGRVLDALAYAHRKRDDDENEINLVHRDVSPQNILISYEGEVKVIDFGLAKSTLSSAKTNPSMILGKFLYMSPEQARHQKVDRRSDLYSAGLCLYELVCGKNPFDEVPPHELMLKVANPVIPPISTVDPLVPPQVQEMIKKSLEQDPAKRFQNAEEFRGKVQSCLLEIDASAGPESLTRYMREAFAVEYQQERKLLSSLKAIARPTVQEDPKPKDEKRNTHETAVFAVKSVAPNDGRAKTLSDLPPPPSGALPKPQPPEAAPRTPLSFAPTPRTREDDARPKPTNDETVPGVILTEELRQAMGPPAGEVAPLTNPWDELSQKRQDDESVRITGERSPLDASEREPDPPTVQIDHGATQPRVQIVPPPGLIVEDTQPRVVVGTLVEDQVAPTPPSGPVLPPPQGRVRTMTQTQKVAAFPEPTPAPAQVKRPASAMATASSSAAAVAEMDTGVRRMPEPPPNRKKKSGALTLAVIAFVGVTLAAAGWFAFDIFGKAPTRPDLPPEHALLPSAAKPIVPPPGMPNRDPRNGPPKSVAAPPPVAPVPPIVAAPEVDAGPPSAAVAVPVVQDAGAPGAASEAIVDAGAPDAVVAAAAGQDAGADALVGGTDDLLAELTAPAPTPEAATDPSPAPAPVPVAAAAAAKKDPIAAKTTKRTTVSPLVKEVRGDWANTQKAFKTLQKKQSCETRQMRMICAQYDMLAPEMEDLSGTDEQINQLRGELRRLQEDIKQAGRKGR